MTVLITGTTGFLGGHLARALAARGESVHGLTRAPDSARLRGPAAAGVRFHPADPATFPQLLAELEPTAVFHLATAYGREGQPDSELVRVNTALPLALLEAAVAARVPLFVHADTCLYTWPLAYQFYRGYVLSKRQFAQWGEAVCPGTATRFVNLRLHHPYGPFDAPTKFVPKIIRDCLASGEDIPLTAGEQRKDFVYVSDVTAAFLAVLDRQNQLPPGYADLECGTGEAVPLRAFVELVHRLTQSKARLRFGAVPYRENETMLLRADPTALSALGWRPAVSPEQGLRQTLREEFGRE